MIEGNFFSRFKKHNIVAMESNNYENKSESYQKVSINENEHESFSEMERLKFRKEYIDNEYEVEKPKNYVKITIIIILIFIFMIYILFFRNKIKRYNQVINTIGKENNISITKSNDIYYNNPSNFVNKTDNNVEIKTTYLSNNIKENEMKQKFDITNNSLTGNENQMIVKNNSIDLNGTKEKINNNSSNSQNTNNQDDNEELYRVYKNIYIKNEKQYLNFCVRRKLIARIHI